MHWLIHPTPYTERETTAILDTLARMGIAHSVHAVVPGTGELQPPAPAGLRRVMCLGSYSMRHSVQQHGWQPGIYDLAEVDFRVQAQHWGERMLNAQATVCALGELQLHAPAFVRPLADSKSFSGRVFEPDDFVHWRTEALASAARGASSLRPSTLVVTGPAQVIHAEYRLWVVDGHIVSSSVYRRGGQPFMSDEVPEAVLVFGRDCLSMWQPAPAFVLDLCDTPHGLKVVELNTINAASFYAGDVQRIVMALHDLGAA